MKKIRLLPALIMSIACLASSTAYAKNIVTYSDDVLSFDYDSDFVASIDFYDAGTFTFAYYSASTSMKNDYHGGSLTININKIDEFEEPWLDFYFPLESNENFKVIEVLEANDDCREIYYESKHFDEPPKYRKLLSFNDDTFIGATYTLSDDEACNEFLKTIYDSLDTSKGYDINGYPFSDEWLSVGIYGKYIFSEQSLNYIRKALEIANLYLQFEVDSSSAYSQINEIRNRFEEYLDDTDYTYDIRLYGKLYYLELEIDSENDAALISVINDIKNMCDIE